MNIVLIGEQFSPADHRSAEVWVRQWESLSPASAEIRTTTPTTATAWQYPGSLVLLILRDKSDTMLGAEIGIFSEIARCSGNPVFSGLIRLMPGSPVAGNFNLPPDVIDWLKPE